MAIKIQGETVIYDDETVRVASGTTAERPTPQTGMLRFNTTESAFEGYDGTAWGPLGGGEGGANAALAPVLTSLTADQTLRWDGEAWVNADEQGSWTPTITFATPGDLSAVYSQQFGDYIVIGRLVVAVFRFVTSTFTHSTGSGQLRVAGLPFASDLNPSTTPMSALSFQGLTKAGYTQFALRVSGGNTFAAIDASASAQPLAGVVAADAPSGGTVDLRGTLIYRRAT